MNNEESKVLIDIRERVVRIETILKTQNYEGVKDTAQEAKEMAAKNAKDIQALQSAVKWFVALIVGAFIASLLSLVLK